MVTLAGWLIGLGRRQRHNRTVVARWFLRLLRPRVLYLVDESGSGQPLLTAAHQLDIRVVAIQHGDFLGNRQYCRGPGGAFDLEPADLLCVWSSAGSGVMWVFALPEAAR